MPETSRGRDGPPVGSRPLRVLLVSDYPPGPTGGAEVQVGRVADALRAAGCEVRIATGDGSHTGWRRALDLWDPAARRRVARDADDLAADVVHYHNVLNELSTSVVGIGRPSVLTVHDPRLVGERFGIDQGRAALAPVPALRSLKDRVARHRLRRHADAVTAPNPVLVERLRADGFRDVHHVEGITPATPHGPPGTDVVFAGVLAEHKGAHVLLDAWQRIADRHPGATLRIVGDGPQRATLDASVRQRDLGARVVLVGAVPPDEVPGQFARAAVVVVPSLGTETQPLAVLEALASGRPVVASRWPGVEATVDDEVGALVPPGDPAALAATLDALLSDRAALVRLGAAAAARAERRWSPAAGAARLLAVYRSVLP
ncbi:MAG TPA: glycosyltransferase family 4 protein [Acidimicrobiales bacterium]|nr:glycosyltransferase family 4 protein [Acidimicrobiales bacterium]